MQWENAAIVHGPCTSLLESCHSVAGSVISLSALHVRTASPKLALRLHLTVQKPQLLCARGGELMNLKLSWI